MGLDSLGADDPQFMPIKLPETTDGKQRISFIRYKTLFKLLVKILGMLWKKVLIYELGRGLECCMTHLKISI